MNATRCSRCGLVYHGQACPQCVGKQFAKALDRPEHSTDDRLDYIAQRLDKIQDLLASIASSASWLLGLAILFATVLTIAALFTAISADSSFR